MSGWSQSLIGEKGRKVGPQPPERIMRDEVIVGYQFSEKVPEGLLYHIRAVKVILGAGR